MLAIFLDGESKSGKTAVGRAIRQALEADGHTVRLLIAGNFFRQLTMLTLRQQPESAEINGDWLEPAVRKILKSDELLLPVEDYSALDTPEIDTAVSAIAQFDFVQHAATGWRIECAQKTLDDRIEIMIFDGRNLRSKLADWCEANGVQVALELIIACRAEVAAARYLSDDGIKNPTVRQVADTTEMINKRRAMDKRRNQAAYTEPADAIQLIVGSHSVDESLDKAWASGEGDVPHPIRFDNSEVPRDDGLATVCDTATKAIQRLQG